jgi:hypothetical protein
VRGVRAALIAAGLALMVYGATLLADQPPVVLVRIGTWAAGGVLLHDFVFAPLCAALGFAGVRLIPGRWRAPVAVAALGTVVLLLLAVPVYDTPGRRPDNLTVLDRDYRLGLAVAVALVWICVPLYLLVARWLPVRQDQVVDRQRADDVEGQPPAV